MHNKCFTYTVSPRYIDINKVHDKNDNIVVCVRTVIINNIWGIKNPFR